MIQDIAPHVFDNAYKICAPRGTDLALYFEKNTVLLKREADNWVIPTVESLGALFAGEAEYLFRVDDVGVFLLDTLAAPPQEPFAMVATNEVRTMACDWMAFAGATASQLNRWKVNRRFCGRCGHEMEKSPTERAMRCPACKNVEYPKICPAVIVAVTDGHKLLMARSTAASYRKFALIAGFVEIGETFEQAVEREVMEEVGLRIKNLRYYKNQPWSFSDTVMIGFTAELDGKPDITLQENELKEARWFTREEIPESTSTISIGRELIERFRRGEL